MGVDRTLKMSPENMGVKVTWGIQKLTHLNLNAITKSIGSVNKLNACLRLQIHVNKAFFAIANYTTLNRRPASFR